MYVYHIRGQWF